MNILLMFYSRYGNTAKLAEGIVEGVRRTEGAEVILLCAR
jgi:flavodoxin